MKNAPPAILMYSARTVAEGLVLSITTLLPSATAFCAALMQFPLFFNVS